MTWRLSWSMRFALALAAVFAIGTLSAGGLSYLLLARQLNDRLERDVRASAEGLARLASGGDADDLAVGVAALSQSVQDGSALFAWFPAGGGPRVGSLKVAEPFTGLRRLRVGHEIAVAPPGAQHDTHSYLAFGIRTGRGWVIAARDEAWMVETGEVLGKTTTVALGFALLLCVALALGIARRNGARVDAMERVLDAAGAGALDRRIDDHGSDDLAELAQRVDAMLARLEAGVAAIRQVSTDVAHDLRAPLTRLRIRLEPLALAGDLPPGARHEIGSALEDLDQISGSFDAILRLARLQSGTVEHLREPVDLRRLACAVTELLGVSAEEAGHVLEAVLPDGPVTVTGDEGLLTQALVNLADNALRHCPVPARIVIGAEAAPGGPRLWVEDDGPGIEPADRGRVLDRFVRLDASRSVPGTGLGLSLVAAIAALHGARLVLADAASGKGLRATLEFPPAASPGRPGSLITNS